MIGRRRRGPLRAALPWLATGLLVAVAALGILRALQAGDPVRAAEALRKGDTAAGRARNPVAALELLERVLTDEPGHVPALFEAARAWQDLRAWDNAIDALQRACDAAPDLKTRIQAKTMAMSLLATADEYDRAVEVGQEIVALEPAQAIHRLRLGPIYLKGSQSAQARLLQHFLGPLEKSAADEAVERRLEAFISNLWDDADAAALVEELTPGADAVLRQQMTELLAAARLRFRQADETLAGWPAYGGFDPPVARAWCQVLLRSGRLFDAHVEAGMALREPGLPVAFRREFLDVQASCAAAVGDWAQAAGKQAAIVEAYAAQADASLPYTTLWAHYEARLRAGDWDWILGHVIEDRARYGRDHVLSWAQAAALAAQGATEAAVAELREPFVAVSLGGATMQSASLRQHPGRRRAIALLAYQLFSASGDPAAGAALDALLAMDPADPEALRLRSALATSQGRHEAAAADAFQLLVPTRRDRADFELWYAARDALSAQRYGNGLQARAAKRVRDSSGLRRSSDEATFEAYKALGLARPRNRPVQAVDHLYVPDDPALSFAIVEELVAAGEVAHARSELRKLSDAFPQVQEFRYRLGRLLVREGQFEFAAAEFRRLLDDVPGDTEALDLAIRTELALGRPQEAAALVTRTILVDPLGAGAVRYGQRLLDRGRADQAQKLVERILRFTDFDARLDVLVLAARAALQLGRLDDTEALLGGLATSHPESFDVALLALDFGLARQAPGLVTAAVAALRPLAPELFPDQLGLVAERLLQAGLHLELVTVFDAAVCALPAARPALRHVAAASKALGDPARADELLGMLGGEPEALVDRFLLACLQGQADEAARRLRLQPESALVLQERCDLCLLAGNALMDLRVLQDATPLERLRALHVEELLEPARLELLDAVLRLLPSMTRLQDVQPRAVVEDPLATYPLAGRDVAALLELAGRDPLAARRAATDLLYLVLMQDREFWADEARQIAEHARLLAPSLAAPARTLARDDIARGRPREALQLLQPLLLSENPEPDDLRLFLQAARDLGHAEWGVALALFFEDRPEHMQALAEAFALWGHPDEARHLYEGILRDRPDDAAAQAGLIEALVDLRRGEEALGVIEQAMTGHPDDEALARTAAGALAGLARPPPRAVSLMQFLWNRHPDLDALGEALARAAGDDADLRREALERLADRVAQQPAGGDALDLAARSQTLVKAARTARDHELPELARRLNESALRLEPGAIGLYRELAFLELELGHLSEARAYLEVLSFVDTADRDAAMELARLDFRRLGQPVRAAEVVRRTFTGTIPPDMVEILAAEAWLLGRPEQAITEFIQVSQSPLVTADTYATILRIAYAGGSDDVARLVGGLFLQHAAADDPRRARVQFLLDRRLPKPAAAPAPVATSPPAAPAAPPPAAPAAAPP